MTEDQWRRRRATAQQSIARPSRKRWRYTTEASLPRPRRGRTGQLLLGDFPSRTAESVRAGSAARRRGRSSAAALEIAVGAFMPLSVLAGFEVAFAGLQLPSRAFGASGWHRSRDGLDWWRRRRSGRGPWDHLWHVLASVPVQIPHSDAALGTAWLAGFLDLANRVDTIGGAKQLHAVGGVYAPGGFALGIRLVINYDVLEAPRHWET